MSATRPWVDAFAEAMERKLALNRHKGDREGWQKLAGSQLTIMLRHEVAELCDAVELARPLDSGKPEGAAARLAVVNECADVANIAMMIADVAGGLVPKACAEAREQLIAALRELAASGAGQEWADMLHGILDCPQYEALHHHGDGCPACETVLPSVAAGPATP